MQTDAPHLKRVVLICRRTSHPGVLLIVRGVNDESFLTHFVGLAPPAYTSIGFRNDCQSCGGDPPILYDKKRYNNPPEMEPGSL